MTCCEHSEQEHVVVSICDEQIHYPSEDYPCLCESFAAGGDGSACASCGHNAPAHVMMRLCRPASGSDCICRRPLVERHEASAHSGDGERS